MAKMHEYPVSASWTGGRKGSGTAKDETNGVSVPIAVGPEFNGAGGGTNPEEMLAMAVASCYLITFGIIAENRKIPVRSMDVKAIGEVEENGPQFTYKKVTLKSKIVLESGADDAQVAMAKDMAHKADNYCIITNCVREKLEIVVEPDVSVG
jgi:peroxiredoxin-like protein